MSSETKDGSSSATLNRTPYALGRVAFMAHMQIIVDKLRAGYPQTVIYAELKDNLAGLSYSQFTYHVRTLAKPLFKESVEVVPVTVKKVTTPQAPGFNKFVPGPTDPNLDDLF